MARISATRAAEAEIFALLKFSKDQIAEARTQVEYTRSNSFGDGANEIPIAQQAEVIAKYNMGSNITNVEGPVFETEPRGKLN